MSAQVDSLTIENGGDGDVLTLSIDGNELDFSFDSTNALTATNLAVAVNSDNTLNVLVNAADAGNGSDLHLQLKMQEHPLAQA